MIALRGIAEKGLAVRGLVDRGIAGLGSLASPFTDALQWLFDSTLVDKTTNGNDSQFVDNVCATFDGDYVDYTSASAVSSLGDFTWVIRCRLDGSGSTQWLWSNTSDPANNRMRHTGSDSLLELNNVGQGIADFPANEWKYIIIRRIGTDVKVFYDDVDSTSGAFTVSGDVDLSGYICSRFGVTGDYTVSRWAIFGFGFTSDQINDLASSNDLPDNALLHYTFCEGSGTKVYDVSGNGNDGTVVLNSSEQQFWETNTQDEVAYFAENGGSKSLDERGTTEIAVSGLVGTETITNNGTATVSASAGKLTVSGGWTSQISIDGTLTYDMRNAYGTTILSSNGTWGGGTLTGGAYLQIPALEDGSDDAEGLGITNPAGLVHNGGLHTTELLNQDGVTIDDGTWEYMATHANFDNNRVKKCTTDGFIQEVVTWPVDYVWTANAYNAVKAWAGGGCLTPALPFPL